MASVEKQMLGTETVRALRAQGVTAKICGCSANNMEEEFLEAGADSFLLKPFPCEKEELRRELLRVLSGLKETKTDPRNMSVDDVAASNSTEATSCPKKIPAEVPGGDEARHSNGHSVTNTNTKTVSSEVGDFDA